MRGQFRKWYWTSGILCMGWANFTLSQLRNSCPKCPNQMYSVTVLTNLYKSRFIPIIQGPSAKYFQDASGIPSTLGKCGLKGLIGCILQVDLTVSFKSLTALLDSRSFQGFDQIQILLLNDCYMFYPREAWVKLKIHTKTFYSILHLNLDLR